MSGDASNQGPQLSQADLDALTGAGGGEAAPPPPLQGRPLDLLDFAVAGARPAENNIDLLNDVELDVKIELGRAQMLIENVLRLGEGAVVELDKLAGDPVDVLVNDRLVARGEVLVLDDSLCVRINEVLSGIGSGEAA
jgi:flagellar motor switch protein FliN